MTKCISYYLINIRACTQTRNIKSSGIGFLKKKKKRKTIFKKNLKIAVFLCSLRKKSLEKGKLMKKLYMNYL